MINKYIYINAASSECQLSSHVHNDFGIKLDPWFLFLTMVNLGLTFIYTAVIPSGFDGLLIVLCSLSLALVLTKNLVTFSVYFLLIGIKTVGMITLAFGYPGLGGKIAFAVGILSLFVSVDIRSVFQIQKKAFFYLFWIVLVLIFFYIIGPKSEYSSYKLINCFVNGLLSIFIFHLLLNSKTINWNDLGRLGVISSLVCLASIFLIFPALKPGWILDFGSMRLAALIDRDILEIRNLSGFLSLIGFVFIYSSNPDRQISIFDTVQFIIFSIISIIILSWGGSRLPFLTVFFVVASMIFFKPLCWRRYKIISIFCMSILFGILIYGFFIELPFISSILEKTGSFGSHLNRDTNWDNALWRISEQPLLGHGLGGYYIETFSWPGSGTYAHNLFLEMLSETGIVGTLSILSPLIWKFKSISYYKVLNLRSLNGGAVFPLLLIFFLRAMISFDLSTNIIFLIFTFIILENYEKINSKRVSI